MKQFKYVINDLKSRAVWYVLFAILIFILNYYYISFSRINIITGIENSFADCLIKSMQKEFMLSVVMPLNLFCCCLIRNELGYNIIVKFSRKKYIWNNTILKVILSNFIFSVIVLMDIIFVAKIKSNILINFDLQHSFYSFYVGNTLEKNPNPYALVLVSFLFCYLLMLAVDFLYILMSWLGWSKRIAFLISFFILYAGAFMGVIFEKIGIGYKHWEPEAHFNLSLLIIEILMIYCVGLFYAERKEFIK